MPFYSYMHSNWKTCYNNVNPLWQCEGIPNNCDRCGKLYRYNWRRRRTRDKTCSLCANEVKCNAVVNFKKERRIEQSVMNFNHKLYEEHLYMDKKSWGNSLPIFQYSDNVSNNHSAISESVKKVLGFQEFTDKLLYEMKVEFGEELQNPRKSLRVDFDWPSTSELSKVDCLRAFNFMKQILLKEISKCGELIPSDPIVLRRKFYLERRFQSLEREKIRRLKVYESAFNQDEGKSGFQYLCKT